MDTKVPEELARVRLLLEKGEYRDALALVDSLKGREGLPADDRLTCSLFEARLRLRLGELEEADALAEVVLQGALGQEVPLLAVDALLVKAGVSYFNRVPYEGLEAVDLGEGLLEGWESDPVGRSADEVQWRRGELLRHRGMLYLQNADLDEARACLQQSLAIHRGLDCRQGIADCLSNLCSLYWSKDNHREAIEHALQSLAIREELGNQDDVA